MAVFNTQFVGSTAALRGTFVLELMPQKHYGPFYDYRKRICRESLRISVYSSPICAAFRIFLTDF